MIVKHQRLILGVLSVLQHLLETELRDQLMKHTPYAYAIGDEIGEWLLNLA